MAVYEGPSPEAQRRALQYLGADTADVLAGSLRAEGTGQGARVEWTCVAHLNKEESEEFLNILFGNQIRGLM